MAARAQAISPGVFADEVSTWRELAAACARDAKACDPGSIPGQQKVEGSAMPAFTVRWGWLQEALRSASRAGPSDRAKAMDQVRAHLATLGVDAEASSAQTTAFSKAQSAAKVVLARRDFQYVEEEPSWLERHFARVQDAVLRLFMGVSNLGSRAPWLAPLIEWSCFGAVAAGLLWWLRRSLQRQAVRLLLRSEGALQSSGKRLASADWVRRAKERAAAKEWREAVHLLYWGAIALLEERRAWRPSAARTPREFLRLLRPGTEAFGALSTMTTAFEQAWYGNASATEPQYAAALASFQQLEAARTERVQPEAMSSAPEASFTPAEGL